MRASLFTIKIKFTDCEKKTSNNFRLRSRRQLLVSFLEITILSSFPGRYSILKLYSLPTLRRQFSSTHYFLALSAIVIVLKLSKFELKVPVTFLSDASRQLGGHIVYQHISFVKYLQFKKSKNPFYLQPPAHTEKLRLCRSLVKG